MGETENSVDWWVQRGRGTHKYFLFCVFVSLPVAQVWLHGIHPVMPLVRVNGFVYKRLGKSHSGWEYELGQCIKGSVMLERLAQGTAHTLYFQAFQIVYNGTCQTSLKAYSMLLTLSQRETSTFPLLGIQPVKNIKEENCHGVTVGGIVSDFDTLFVVCVFCS